MKASGGGVQPLPFPKRKCIFEKTIRINEGGVNWDKKVLGENTVEDELEWDKVNAGKHWREGEFGQRNNNHDHGNYLLNLNYGLGTGLSSSHRWWDNILKY